MGVILECQMMWQSQQGVSVNAIMPKGFCCFMCGHCDDEVIAEMMECKCKCHG